MKALLVIDSDAAYRLVTFYLKPLGFEFVRYRTPLKAMDNIDEVDPEAVIISAEDFPRHWKTIAQFIRSERNKEKTTVIVLKGPTFSYEDAAKAVQVGVNGIASDNLNDPEELDRLQNMLGRYRSLRNQRTSRRIRPTEEDRIEFIFVTPNTGAIAAVKILSFSTSGISFDPVDPGLMEGIEIGTEFPECSLKVENYILSPACKLVRIKPAFAFSFASMSETEKVALESYIRDRPVRDRRLPAAT